jgi:glycosyltransferase involved in cell wall biosynthesis
MPEISVIIPCFNQGRYIDDAIKSVIGQTFRDFEIIVVNDGSTESGTIERLHSIDYPRTRVLHTRNLGLPGARNLAIRNAAGKYILPLDADDKIAPSYLEKAHAVIAGHTGIGIVYCKGAFFGNRSGPWNLPAYRFPDILLSPRIHSCGLFRKTDWAAAGGYCEEMVDGWEDYDLWLSLIEMGCGVHRIPEALFYYRQHDGNMTTKITKKQSKELYGAMFRRHKALYEANILGLILLGGSFYRRLTRLEGANQALRASLSWRVAAPLRRLENLFTWKDGPLSSLATEANLILWRLQVSLPLTVRGKALRSEVRRLKESGLFNSKWYCDRYEAMPAVSGHPILHYLLIGGRLGCDPSPNFDSRGYMAENPGIDWEEVTPLAHYLCRQHAGDT